MKPNRIAILLLAVAGLLAGLASARAAGEDREALIAHGRYLVENVVGCADCHSARDQQGRIIPAQHLMGAPLPFAPTVPMPAWGAVSTQIAGLPGYTEEQAVRLFTTGLKPDGTMPRPPMPQFRFNEADARAVTAYLKSLAK